MLLDRLDAVLGGSRVVEGSSHLFSGQRRNVAAGMEGSRVVQALGRHGGRTRCQLNVSTTAQPQPADGIAGTVNVPVPRARVSRRGEPTLGDDCDCGHGDGGPWRWLMAMIDGGLFICMR